MTRFETARIHFLSNVLAFVAVVVLGIVWLCLRSINSKYELDAT